MRKNKLTLRLNEGEYFRLSEIKQTMKISYSLLIRSIIQDFLNRNEKTLDRIIDKKEEEDADS